MRSGDPHTDSYIQLCDRALVERVVSLKCVCVFVYSCSDSMTPPPPTTKAIIVAAVVVR